MKKGRSSGDPGPARLRTSREQAKQAILGRIDSGKAMLGMPVRSKAALEDLRALSYTWNDGNKGLLQKLFSDGSVAEEYSHEFLFGAVGGVFDLAEEEEDAKKWIKGKVRRLEGVVEQVQFMDEPAGLAKDPRPTEESDAMRKLDRLLRFDRFVRALRNRHDNRDPFTISDEFDVQDLVRALLSLDFDDVRPEEWTPSYAGGASRVDFLLKGEKIVLEVKMTRAGLTDRQLGDELMIDIGRYRSHPDCKVLVCFIYDPDHLLRNPVGLAKDLEALGTDLQVRVLVTPR